MKGKDAEGEWAKTIGLTIHELTHVLILSSNLFKFFVDENRMFCFVYPPLFPFLSLLSLLPSYFGLVAFWVLLWGGGCDFIEKSV